MKLQTLEVRIKGKNRQVPALSVGNRFVIQTGRFLKVATVHDEQWLEADPVPEPEALLKEIRQSGFKADIFAFSQRLPKTDPEYGYRLSWDNVAAIRIINYDHWWKECVPQETRKNVRRSAKRGVVVKQVALDDAFIQGVTDIYNETPFRQGKKFPHYGKSFDRIKSEISTLLDHSEFIGAYFEGELVGFIKLVHMDGFSSVLHIVSKNAHYDKRPSNALLAKAVEISAGKGKQYLVYGRYSYGNKSTGPLVEFKKRNGFEEIRLPRYYVPLSMKGRLAMRLSLHRGLLALVPGGILSALVRVRAAFLEKRFRVESKTTDRSEAMAGVVGEAITKAEV
jgi:hypothetical protein